MTQAAYMTVPKVLLTDPKYQRLNPDAILLYSSLVDRLKLSMKNGKAWVDKKGNTFIYYTRKAMCALLKKSEPYVRKLLALLKECGLLVERRQGLTKPNILFPVLLEADVQSSKKHCSVPERNEISASKPYSNKPYKKNHMQGGKASPYRRREGETWEENGQMMIFSKGYSQRHYTREELNALIEPI